MLGFRLLYVPYEFYHNTIDMIFEKVIENTIGVELSRPKSTILRTIKYLVNCTMYGTIPKGQNFQQR